MKMEWTISENSRADFRKNPTAKKAKDGECPVTEETSEATESTIGRELRRSGGTGERI